MGYEIDFLPVGKDKSGDAIVIRYGNLFGPRTEQKVIVVDAGYVDSAKTVIEHLDTHCGTREIDLLISTHPDQDHIGGMESVLNDCVVRQLWMHQPWNHTTDIAELFVHGHVTDQSVKTSLRKSLDEAHSLEQTAQKRGIPITEPFAGTSFDNKTVFVLGPTKDFYESLLPLFRCTPEAKFEGSLLKGLIAGATAFVKTLAEGWNIETLGTPSEDTTAENNSSAVLLFQFEDHSVLLTADAGLPALIPALQILESAKYDLSKIKLVQIPHHGSSRNVSADFLDRLLGPRLPNETATRCAFVSVAKADDPKHPSKKVTNAFKRRGAPAHMTAGVAKCYFRNSPAPNRGGNWGPSTPLPLYTEVEG
jgi:beta-lactamase superfamily II metal-dependent hydrolase